MKAKQIEKIRVKANKIVAEYNGYRRPEVLQLMYRELEQIGVTTGLISGGRTTCEWYIDGVEVQTSLYVYEVYEGQKVENDYTIYFS